ncbi:DUF4352 domain-containing protein [Cytobacillus sp. Sa5YUA1]|uniref:DUF4352 domain-containing protein n=1 Tax=Cytobacillus stercorigallinarum TaxID=2762240 RepID=A0ABR8QW03_9BACI|nr:DUF4352 domain-containing protein [Cytobacillus stercorigallinarum]MBD7939442.1 DUF4352 domain-containing protein [Cytobacillus stercorigallinarum]
MKKFFKFGCLGFIGLIVLIIVIAVVGGGDDEPASTGADSNTSDNAKSNDKPKEEKKEEPKLAAIGETLKVGDVEFTVNDKTTSDNVGGEFGQNAQATYLILDVTVTNKGNEAITVDSNFFKLMSGEKTFESDTTAGVFANEQADFFLSQVNPDLSLTGKVVFDLTEEVINSEDLLLNVQTGIFGTEQGQINIAD